MDKLDGPNVDSTRRLRYQQQLWFNLKLTANDQLLLIAARERPRRQIRIRRAHIKPLNDVVCPLANCHAIQQDAGVTDYWLAIVDSEDRILGEIEFEQ